MEESTKSLNEEPFERCRTLEKPGVAKVCFHEHAMRPHCDWMGERAHGAQNIVVVSILPFFLGEKREEFFFRTTLIQHRGFSQPQG